ncbi:N-acetyltransferase family protein [Runella sp.]|uniref:GNAT family N-acetyltransferase n=1 Tax=Runella sp. TaxID=1960881 RepID=UPI003D14E990
MFSRTKNGKEIYLKKWAFENLEALTEYLVELNHETKKRFAPHAFDIETLKTLFQKSEEYSGYIATEPLENKVIAYCIVKSGILPKDAARLEQLGLIFDQDSDLTIAPSVADAWQSEGVGSLLMHFIVSDIRLTLAARMVLWGGVQRDNQKAIRFYLKHGFKIVGQFERKGLNYDMVLDL